MASQNHLKRRLNIIFIAMATVMLFACGLFYYSWDVQSSYAKKIALTTRQKANIQEISKDILLIESKISRNEEITQDLKNLEVISEQWLNAQRALLNGNTYFGTDIDNSAEVQKLWQEVSPAFVKSNDIIKEFKSAKQPMSHEAKQEFEASVDTYVNGVNNITGKYLSESESNGKLVQMAFWGILAAAVILCVLAFYRVMNPLKSYITQSFNDVEELEEKLVKADNAKTEFLSNMSHEVRTPLNGVIGMTELLARTQLNEEQRNYVRNIHGSAHNLLDLVNDVLDYSKLQSGKLELHKERFNISDCVDQVIDLMKPTSSNKKLELMSDIDPALPLEIVSDERRLKQVLLNLVNNAVKFTENGEVVVKAELVNREADFVQIRFSVRDTGIGIDQAAAGDLFQSFYQVDSSISKKYGGSGLGLAISKNLVQELGGRIWVESKPGQGSTFSFTMVAETSGTTQQAKIDALHGMRALVVDDNKTNLKILVKQLSAWGIQATPFNSPELVTEIMANLHKFDFVIMDMQMPEMDGKSLAKKIRAQYSMKELPLIVLSSVGEHLMLDEENLYNAYLTKPVKQSRLLDTIIEVLKISPVQQAKEKLAMGNREVMKSRSNLRILIAHDNDLSRAVTVKTLQLLGHKYESVSTGKEVIEKSRRDDYDLIIMDVKMSEMDGLETTRQLKKRVGKNGMPVIIGVTENEKRDKDQCIQAGMDDMIEKPMKPEVLQQKIHYWLESE